MTYQIYRDNGFGAKKKRPRKLKPSFRRWKLNRLTDSLRKCLKELQQDKSIYFTAEELANKFRAKKHLVEQAIKKFRLEGLVGEELNRAPHDSNRDPFCGFKGWSAWGTTLYKLIGKNNVKK